MNKAITVQVGIDAPIERVWKLWIAPEHITKWNNASDAWHTPRAENDLRAGGKFSYRMEAKDGSSGFDFAGVYDTVKMHELISYTLDDGRKVSVQFENIDGKTQLIETFEIEKTNPESMQREGWQSILDNFKEYAENLEKRS